MKASFDSYERRQFLRFTRTERWPMLDRHPVAGTVHQSLLAGMLGIGWEQVEAELDAMRAETARAAAGLLGDATLRAAIERLPGTADDRVVAVGDSITADRLGWFEMLTVAVQLTGGGGGSLRNLGLSGNTTADVLERFDLIEAARPTRVLLMLGTNDARRHGRSSGHRMATAPETERNLRVLTELITHDLGARVTLITPPVIDGGAVEAFFEGLPLSWDTPAVADVAGIVRKIDADCVDLYAAMEGSGLPGLLEADGVHPTVAGQQFVLSTILRHLSR
ncbi:GDSL-type esterase/lipase family protein [Actinoplanes sp. N902-109]|uniref:SGNH/GDSL hydrolase family protein n=1 Tax=Actinoplanes sp. (strain N902-109) TaxID=649831 RepID=UPI00032959E9|nr:GDSL-type esterase/lipase family protein [Actinoplanes sp. N902-109]AGL19095.1 alpha/beta hydrolase fold-3 domain protein [Actinoplanes sp. N902-109]